MGRGLLLWLIGIPIPIILLIWIFGDVRKREGKWLLKANDQERFSGGHRYQACE